MDRNEIALKFAVARVSADIDNSRDQGDPARVVEFGFACADAFLAAAAPKDAPSSPPSCEATPRPEWVRVVSKNGWETTPFTIGKVYRVERWSKAGRPEVRNDEGGCWELSLRGDKPDDKFSTFASWVPAEPPRSVGRAMLAAVRDALAKVDVDYWVTEHGWRHTVLGLKEVEAAHRAEVERAVAAEREACAALCPCPIGKQHWQGSCEQADAGEGDDADGFWNGYHSARNEVAAAIRARGGAK